VPADLERVECFALKYIYNQVWLDSQRPPLSLRISDELNRRQSHDLGMIYLAIQSRLFYLKPEPLNQTT